MTQVDTKLFPESYTEPCEPIPPEDRSIRSALKALKSANEQCNSQLERLRTWREVHAEE